MPDWHALASCASCARRSSNERQAFLPVLGGAMLVAADRPTSQQRRQGHFSARGVDLAVSRYQGTPEAKKRLSESHFDSGVRSQRRRPKSTDLVSPEVYRPSFNRRVEIR